ERERGHRAVRTDSENPGGHQQGRAGDHCLARMIDGPTARDEISGKPAAGERPDICRQIRNPREESDFCEAESAGVVQILREPSDVEPPNRIGNETGNDDSPELAVMEEASHMPLTRRCAPPSPRCA